MADQLNVRVLRETLEGEGDYLPQVLLIAQIRKQQTGGCLLETTRLLFG